MSAAGLQQDTLAPFAGTLGPVQQPFHGRRDSAAPQLRVARTAREAGFDRLTFEFSGDNVPGYEVAYTSAPLHRCGSGDSVSLAASGVLVVRFEPAQAHDEQGRSTIPLREWTPALPVVQELMLVCDFEGQVEWAVGLVASRRYRVLEAARPTRVIVDVRHRD